MRTLRTTALALAFSGAGVVAVAQEPAAPAQAAMPAGPIDELPPDQQISDNVIELAGWIIASGDNVGRPFTIIDKTAAQILVFGANGKVLGAGPVLIGSAVGDQSAPGVADRELRNIPMEDRTTPAGRFIAAYGPALQGERALWIDYDNAVSIHALTTGQPEEKREERLATPEVDDNRITHGCINVSPVFYEQVVSPNYQKGGLFYILPEVMELGEAIPGFAGGGVKPAA